jgi:hypothetical protein
LYALWRVKLDMSKDSGHGNGGNVGVKSSVADVLERDLDGVINEWLVRVEREPELTAIPLNFEDRTVIFLSFCAM